MIDVYGSDFEEELVDTEVEPPNRTHLSYGVQQIQSSSRVQNAEQLNQTHS